MKIIGGIAKILLGIIAFLFAFLLIAFIFEIVRPPVFVNASVAFQNPLYIPPVLKPALRNGEKIFELTLQKGQMEFLPGKSTDTWGINGPYLGPTIRIRPEEYSDLMMR